MLYTCNLTQKATLVRDKFAGARLETLDPQYSLKGTRGMVLTDKPVADDKNPTEEPTRADEGGDVAEANAPTAGEENVGMNTILGVGPLIGVQRDAGDE